MIQGGYYLKARKIRESQIAHAPPHVREIWDLLLLKCSYTDGSKLKRGQCLLTYRAIQDFLAWYVGWRKMTYTYSQIETAMKWLKKTEMITKRKTTLGMVITVCNYDVYQNPKNYESYKELDTRYTGEPNDSKEIKNKEKKFIKEVYEYNEKYPPDMLDDFIRYWTEMNKLGKKMKFELEKTWETSKRLTTWEINSKEFRKKKVSNNDHSLYQYESPKTIQINE